MNLTTGQFRAMAPLPPGTPNRARVSLAVVRFLAYHNRLDGLLPFVAMWWGAWTLVFPAWWVYWPQRAMITRDLFGHPEAISWVLLTAGAIRYFGRHRGWQKLCACAAMAKFVCWGTLTTELARLQPIASAGVAMYSAMSIAELVAYVNVVAGIDRCRHD